MAASNFAKCLSLVLAHEGGYVNHPRDPGGATNKGITQKVYDAFRSNAKKPLRSVRYIDDVEVEAIYKVNYWDRAKCDQLPAGVDYAVFDYAVNSGVSRAVKDLQRVVGAPVDGAMGEITLRATISYASRNPPLYLVVQLCERRMSFLKSLKTWSTFGTGWTRRVMGSQNGVQPGDSGVVDYAAAMIENAARPSTTFPAPADPAPIGAKPGEEGGKGNESDQAALKTTTGLGVILASAGAGGHALIVAAEEVRPHMASNEVGAVAIVAFAALMIVGVGLIAWKWDKTRREKTAK